MEGLYYLAYIIAVLVVIQWYTKNEGGNGGHTSGLLAMKDPDAAEVPRRRRKDRAAPRFKTFGEE